MLNNSGPNGTERTEMTTKLIVSLTVLHINEGRDSSVGIATRYGLDGPGIEAR